MDTNMNTPGYVSKHGITKHLFKCVQPRAQKQRTSHETKMNATSCFGRDRGNYCWRGKVVSVTVDMTVVIIVGVEGDLCGPWV